MADEFPNEGQYAQRIGEGGDRWRCSLCSGYVRGNAPMCKHCHARFGAPEPTPHEAAAVPTEPGEPLTLRQKVAFGFMAAFTVVICVGCYMLAVRIGGNVGIVTGWMLPPVLLTLAWTIIPFSFGERFDKGAPESISFLVLLWIFLTLLVLPIMIGTLMDSYFTAWWGQPFSVGVILTLYTLIAVGFTQMPMFKNDATDTDEQNYTPQTFLSDWRKNMLTIVLPFTVLAFIDERYDMEWVYLLGLPLLIHAGFRNWLWTRWKALWQRISSRS